MKPHVHAGGFCNLWTSCLVTVSIAAMNGVVWAVAQLCLEDNPLFKSMEICLPEEKEPSQQTLLV